MQAAKAIETKNTAPIAAPAKTQDFKETLRSASDPKAEQPVHGNADAKGGKKEHEEKKDHMETVQASVIPAPAQLPNLPVVPVSNYSADVSAAGNADSSSTPVFLASVVPSDLHGQTLVALALPVEEDAVSGGQLIVASTKATQPDEQSTGVETKDAPAASEPRISEKSDDKAARAESLITAAVPAPLPSVVSGVGVTAPVHGASSSTYADKSQDAGKQKQDLPEAKTGNTDVDSNQALGQAPLPAQEFATPQMMGAGDLFKGSQVSAAKAVMAGLASGNPASKGKIATTDPRGKREDAKVDVQEGDKEVSTQPAAKLPIPVAAMELNTSHAGSAQGNQVAALPQANAATTPGSDSSQSFASPKDASTNIVASAPTANAANGLDPAATPALSSAHLVQSIHQSEMKLGMNSAEFGSISISTAVSHQSLSAQISLDHPELSRVLSSHLSAVEEKLGQAYGLQAKVEVRDAASSSYEGSQQQEKGDSPSSRGPFSRGVGTAFVSKALTPTAATVTTSSMSRLDIRI